MSDEKAILHQRDLWKEAVEAGDVDAVMSFYLDDPEYVAFDIMPPIRFRGTEAFRENWVRFFELFEAPPRFEFADMRVTTDGELAFVTGFTRFRGTVAGAEIDSWCRETNCLREVDGAWLLVHDHISFPVDLDSGRGRMDLLPD